MSAPNRFIATCPTGIEGPLADELRALGVSDVQETSAAVTFTGPLEAGYRACLWSRLASRVLLELTTFPAATADELYEGVAAVPWEDHVSPDGTIAARATGVTSGLTHTNFTAQKAKDAVVDRFREKTGRRPSVDLERPDLRINIRLRSEQATLSIDLAGEPLHRRGYRTPGEQVEAPLKEHLAAAILIRAGWPEVAARGGSLLDPMCGSGTLLIEGAAMAADQAPGLLRQHWGFLGWFGHQEDTWNALLDEADERAEAGRETLPLIAGQDSNERAVEIAQGCARRAGFGREITFVQENLGSFARPADAVRGLVVTNPPHGLRLGDPDGLRGLYGKLGERLRADFGGWQAAVFTSEQELAYATDLRSHKQYSLVNARVKTKLYLFDIHQREEI